MLDRCRARVPGYAVVADKGASEIVAVSEGAGMSMVDQVASRGMQGEARRRQAERNVHDSARGGRLTAR